MIKTEAGELMKQQNPMENIDKADENADGVIDGQELLRQELMKQGNIVGAPDMPEMNMGGLMHGGMGVIIGIEEESGNEIPAGSKPEEVADDIPAMLSEGEYVIPADVVRYHGLKTFEEMRCEAKMGLGLMAQDGRIAMVDDDTKEPVEYDIEEKDKPEVEEAKVKVVEAAEGTDVQVDDTETTEPEPILPFYQLRYITDPDTGRTRMAYVDPVTGQEVSPETYEESRASRFAPQTVLEQEGIVEKVAEEVTDEEEEDQTPSCPIGQVFNPATGRCENIRDNGGDGFTPSAPTPYAEQLTTKIAERLGPLSEKDLADQEGATLADKALSRMMEPSSVGPGRLASSVLGGPVGMLTALGINQYDAVGAKRAALTRAEEFAADPTAYGAYNFTFDPTTGAFKQTKATTRILDTEDEYGVTTTDYNSFGQSGKEYTRDDVFAEGQNPFDKTTALGDVFAGIEDDFDALTEVTGASPGNEASEGSGNDGIGAAGAASDNSAGDTTTDDQEEADSADNKMASGGYVSRKNTPRTAMIKY